MSIKDYLRFDFNDLLVTSIEGSIMIVQETLNEFENPKNSGTTCTAGNCCVIHCYSCIFMDYWGYSSTSIYNNFHLTLALFICAVYFRVFSRTFVRFGDIFQ